MKSRNRNELKVNKRENGNFCLAAQIPSPLFLFHSKILIPINQFLLSLSTTTPIKQAQLTSFTKAPNT